MRSDWTFRVQVSPSLAPIFLPSHMSHPRRVFAVLDFRFNFLGLERGELEQVRQAVRVTQTVIIELGDEIQKLLHVVLVSNLPSVRVEDLVSQDFSVSGQPLLTGVLVGGSEQHRDPCRKCSPFA